MLKVSILSFNFPIILVVVTSMHMSDGDNTWISYRPISILCFLNFGFGEVLPFYAYLFLNEYWTL